MTKLRRKKGGFSIAEVVIAISVVLSVTLCALSIALSSISIKKSEIARANARDFAKNACECFKASESEEEFESLLFFAEGVALGEPSYLDGGSVSYIHSLEGSKLTAKITLSFLCGERPSICVEITDADGKSVVSLSYERGELL